MIYVIYVQSGREHDVVPLSEIKILTPMRLLTTCWNVKAACGAWYAG